MARYYFKFADRPDEFEQIHRLNYRAFVEEIPQHPPNPKRRLVDKFHAENTYAIVVQVDHDQIDHDQVGHETVTDGAQGAAAATSRREEPLPMDPETTKQELVTQASVNGGVAGGKVVAMSALRSRRPFSLDAKLDNLDDFLPPHRSLCEFRLLYVEPEHRNGKVLYGLIDLIGRYSVAQGHDLALISGTIRQQRLYRHLGFVPFGPPVGQDSAQFQPMYLTLDAAMRQTPYVGALKESEPASSSLTQPAVQSGIASASRRDLLPSYHPPLNFLPGPVNMSPQVLARLAQPPISHRSRQFLQDLEAVRQRLCRLVGAEEVVMMVGSGTLANEVVAAQLVESGPGLVLVNGEFGERLARQAGRWGLDYTVFAVEWGECIDPDQVAVCLDARPDIRWLWSVHCETSSGVVNDLEQLASLCRHHNVGLYADCISSIGAAPVNLASVCMATGTSGKALGAMAGIALVFINPGLAEATAKPPPNLPGYLDLRTYQAAGGVPYTMPVNLVYGLEAALDWGIYSNATQAADDAARLRSRLRAKGFDVVGQAEALSPAVTTVALPPSLSSVWLGEQAAQHGFWLSYQSGYLVERNWLQICLMGDYSAAALPKLIEVLDYYANIQPRLYPAGQCQSAGGALQPSGSVAGRVGDHDEEGAFSL